MLPTLRNNKPVSNSLLGQMREPMFNYSELFPFDNLLGVEFDSNEVRIDVPGFNQDNLEVYFDQGYVTVKGGTDTRKMNKTVFVGNGTEINKCHVKDGVLTVKLTEHQQSSKSVAVEKG